MKNLSNKPARTSTRKLSPSDDYALQIWDKWQKAVESIIETGKLLVKAKAALPHGQFTNMIARRPEGLP